MMIAKRLIASTLVLSCTLMSMPVHALIVPTEALVETEAGDTSGQRARIDAFFAREDVRLALVQQGVDPQAALARVAAMSDAEAAQLAGRIEQAPAGGEVLGILFTLFIVLLVTDILGFTKVFPFTRSIR
ncbi:PA2779 family protein [Paucibacter sediminis]|uniref:PA2779 family protein n=1 Tax=Paucibacter sediminis TaxID=3019553 RepID=A0AA95ND28_9BURK|nr:PA2779 family protein [Paucibacter sp. S2-9]WIT11488.1 PA2779 family protein [Paucibacter sp. S2-9]